MITRRTLGGLAIAPWFVVAGDAFASAPQPKASEPLGLRTFMRMYASLQAETVWYWYSGAIDIAEPGAPVAPLVGVDSLVRRDIAPQSDGSFSVTGWEAHFYHAPGEADSLNALKNPRTGRIVQPFHFREGPNASHFTEQSLESFDGAGVKRATLWRQAGPYVWLSREVDVDTPHPLDIAKWPMETSGVRNQFGSFAVHCAKAADLMDPAIDRADCTFNYEAISGWLPWLLMGQRPGYLVWRANGYKLSSLDEIPAASRRGFEQTNPAIFAKGIPWNDRVLLWDDFRKQRTPAAP